MPSNSNVNGGGAVATMSMSSPLIKPTPSPAGGRGATVAASITSLPNGNRRGPLDLQVRIDTTGKQSSTTISTSTTKKQQGKINLLPIQDLFQDQSLDINERRLLIQMDFVQRARTLIKELKHPDMQENLTKIESTKQKRLHLATIKDQYLENCVNVLFNYECEEANSEFLMKCEKLRQEMLEEIQQEIDYIQEQRQHLLGGSSNANTSSKNSSKHATRKTRSTRSKGDKDLVTGDLLGSLTGMAFAYDTAQKIKKKAGYVFQPLEKRLAPSEVDHDVRELTATLEATKKRRIETKADMKELIFAKYHRSKFLYKDLILQEGDEILVRTIPSTSEYAAIICGLTSTEVFVLSEKGNYLRLMVNDLRTNKLVLVLAPEQSSSSSTNNNSSSNKRR